MRTYVEYKRTDEEGKEIFKKMFEVRHVAHVKHLQSKSYSEHKALDSFYTQILETVDEFIETYQGQYGIIADYGTINDSTKSAINYLTEFAKDLKNYHAKLSEDTHLQNILDEMTAITYRTLYKLNNLK